MRDAFTAIGRGWRIAATGLCFGIFGMGGLVLCWGILPASRLLGWRGERRRGLARALISGMFRLFIRIMRAMGVMRYDYAGLERLNRQGLLILANHPTLIDTVFLIAFVRDADCVVNAALWENPFTGGAVRAAGYIRNDSGLSLVDNCLASIARGSNMVIFPEGTRTPVDGQLDFKRGAAQVAVRGVRDVTPVVIRCVPRTLGKGEKWWSVPPRRAHFTIEVRDDIPVGLHIEDASEPALAARALNAHLEQFFTMESQAV
jgi:1-acyl-sn-glycerol-3-phosphate acyltransferase